MLICGKCVWGLNIFQCRLKWCSVPTLKFSSRACYWDTSCCRSTATTITLATRRKKPTLHEHTSLAKPATHRTQSLLPSAANIIRACWNTMMDRNIKTGPHTTLLVPNKIVTLTTPIHLHARPKVEMTNHRHLVGHYPLPQRRGRFAGLHTHRHPVSPSYDEATNHGAEPSSDATELHTSLSACMVNKRSLTNSSTFRFIK